MSAGDGDTCASDNGDAGDCESCGSSVASFDCHVSLAMSACAEVGGCSDAVALGSTGVKGAAATSLAMFVRSEIAMPDAQGTCEAAWSSASSLAGALAPSERTLGSLSQDTCDLPSSREACGALDSVLPITQFEGEPL